MVPCSAGVPTSPLQFGHGSVAVETCVRNTPTASCPAVLQFGHGSVAVETTRSCPSGAPGSGFNSATARSPWRPRGVRGRGSRVFALQFGHGSVAVETVMEGGLGGAWRRVLQFGHGSVAVETKWLWAASSACSGLQFGHGSVAVETSAPPRPWASRRCFNSATARSPWRPPGQDGQPLVLAASIRPRLGRRGDRRRQGGAAGREEASIRPRLGRRGDPPSAATRSPRGQSFNSATARSPWRHSFAFVAMSPPL